jgi:diadenosine tetraphosphate (Ap4A) HIT family hydrolase
VSDDRRCPFCREIAELKPASGPVARLTDAHPVSEGHVLIVPVRHVERLEDLSYAEWSAVFAEVHRAAWDITAIAGVDGMNIGINSGVAAGQTVPHAHVHVIPRRIGDCEDPRGGVRSVLGHHAAYWSDDPPS